MALAPPPLPVDHRSADAPTSSNALPNPSCAPCEPTPQQPQPRNTPASSVWSGVQWRPFPHGLLVVCLCDGMGGALPALFRLGCPAYTAFVSEARPDLRAISTKHSPGAFYVESHDQFDIATIVSVVPAFSAALLVSAPLGQHSMWDSLKSFAKLRDALASACQESDIPFRFLVETSASISTEDRSKVSHFLADAVPCLFHAADLHSGFFLPPPEHAPAWPVASSLAWSTGPSRLEPAGCEPLLPLPRCQWRDGDARCRLVSLLSERQVTERSGNLLYPVNQDFPSIGVPLGPEDREVLLGYTAGFTQDLDLADGNGRLSALAQAAHLPSLALCLHPPSRHGLGEARRNFESPARHSAC